MNLVEPTRRGLARALALVLPLYVLAEVNYPLLATQAQLALFAALGLALAFLAGDKPKRAPLAALDLALALASLAIFLYVVVQNQPLFERFWSGGRSLGDRAGLETPLDFAVGIAGLLLILEATRRLVGVALPILSLVFLLYAGYGSALPDWLLPHRGYGLERIVGQTFLQSQGVFGVALKVMFSYVFLFVVFGALLEATGATGYIVGAGRRLFGRATGGPAKVAVFSSGLLGSLSGSAVANTATTGTFTIPMMRSAGFRGSIAAGIEAAASSGGALVPPVMGAGAYMMLELVDPPVTYFEIIRAALIPACLYYLSIFLMVHFYARRLEMLGEEGSVTAAEDDGDAAALPVAGDEKLARWEGVVVVGALGTLVALLLAGFTVFRAVSLSMLLVLVLGACVRRTRIGPGGLVKALEKSARAGMPLIGAAACVGIVIGVVTLTGAGTRLPAVILPLAQDNLPAALLVIMLSSIVLGMGLPSAVCYLLLATLIGPVLQRLGVVPLAAHLFIFYFGLMSMVTPPVALAAYAASSIAGTKFIRTSFAAFRFALVGFALPFMFVFRPQLLMLAPDGGTAGGGRIALAVAAAALGIVPLAAALAGYLKVPLDRGARVLLFVAALLALSPGIGPTLYAGVFSWLNLAGLVLFVAVWVSRRRSAS